MEERQQRFEALGQQGITLWFTGLSGSGKTTIAEAVEKKLVFQYAKRVYRVDGDMLRSGINKDLDFSAEDRQESMRRAAEISAMFNDAGNVAIVSLISPMKAERQKARDAHVEKKLSFLEVFMDVSLETVQKRDPKGLYAKVAAGEIKGFTGVDAPYEAPTDAEIVIQNEGKTVEECADLVIERLRSLGYLKGSTSALAAPDGGEIVDLLVPESERAAKEAEIQTLIPVLLRDVDVNWLQVIAEGWASPLRGFMREGVLQQTLHFNSVLVERHGLQGKANAMTVTTDFDSYGSKPPIRVSMPLPIILPCSDYTKMRIAGQSAVALTDKDGNRLAILRNPEVYEHRKEELIARSFGFVDPEHPYVKLINDAGDWVIGGEIELVKPIRYNDGLDKYRLTAKELRAKFESMNADAVFAFQTRNPTHAGHAYLMNDARRQLKEKGFKNPILWLSPLGGWTKKDDMPLDVRVKQHECVLAEYNPDHPFTLDPDKTVMAIWPAPMVYGGPTEVQFHAKSRRIAGASYFVVGRDPAGMPYSKKKQGGTNGGSQGAALAGEDIYKGEHGRYVLQMSPGLGDMSIMSFGKVYYDKTDHRMKPKEKARADDFISISGSKMRKLAALGAVPCINPIPSDLVKAKCIPPDFMVPTGWQIMIDYYQNKDTKTWKPWSKLVPALPSTAASTTAVGEYGALSYTLSFEDSAKPVSPWHQIALKPTADTYNFIVEIPSETTAKMEVQKEVAHNPIMQDSKKGVPRYYTYGVPFFNYGLAPQTWEDPATHIGNFTGDNDPLDMMEVGSIKYPMGSVVPVKVLGSFEMIDEGELDYKIIVISTEDPDASKINDISDLAVHKPGTVELLLDWLKKYKTTDGKELNVLTSDTPANAAGAKAIIDTTHEHWKSLASRKVATPDGFFVGEAGTNYAEMTPLHGPGR